MTRDIHLCHYVVIRGKRGVKQHDSNYFKGVREENGGTIHTRMAGEAKVFVNLLVPESIVVLFWKIEDLCDELRKDLI